MVYLFFFMKGGISDSQNHQNIIRLSGFSASNLRMRQHVLRCPRFHPPVSEGPCRRRPEDRNGYNMIQHLGHCPMAFLCPILPIFGTPPCSLPWVSIFDTS